MHGIKSAERKRHYSLRRIKSMWVGKEYKISSAHFLPEHPTCGKVHGHTYTISVAVEGKPKDGFVIDFKVLNETVHKVLDPLDHDLLNNHLKFPSCEYLSHHICKELSYLLPEEIREVRIRVQEGEGGWAECHNLTM
jgi:6-pyruvoyltetrahydropterin/6-carboxytetrahydropterin synthase